MGPESWDRSPTRLKSTGAKGSRSSTTRHRSWSSKVGSRFDSVRQRTPINTRDISVRACEVWDSTITANGMLTDCMCPRCATDSQCTERTQCFGRRRSENSETHLRQKGTSFASEPNGIEPIHPPASHPAAPRLPARPLIAPSARDGGIGGGGGSACSAPCYTHGQPCCISAHR